jgi:gliding motility-associated-like protein
VYWVDVWYGGCKGSDTLMVDEYPFCTAQVPTAFTPNEDGTNDTLFVYGSGIQTLLFQVYNRYGQLVFETSDIHQGWDGKTNGKKQENEVYLYYLKAICFDGGLTEKSGNITLIR